MQPSQDSHPPGLIELPDFLADETCLLIVGRAECTDFVRFCGILTCAGSQMVSPHEDHPIREGRGWSHISWLNCPRSRSFRSLPRSQKAASELVALSLEIRQLKRTSYPGIESPPYVRKVDDWGIGGRVMIELPFQMI